MTRVLITAFGPYDQWETNASWLALVELTRDLPAVPQVMTRRYPVDYPAMRARLEEDLLDNYDVVLHMGQAPGAGCIHLEAIGINVGGLGSEHPDGHQPLVDGGPIAFRSTLPLSEWAAQLRGEGIPARVSYHAGTYLCNATLYLTHYLCQHHQLKTQTAFVHLPLSPTQVLSDVDDLASMSSSTAARALCLILDDLKP